MYASKVSVYIINDSIEYFLAWDHSPQGFLLSHKIKVVIAFIKKEFYLFNSKEIIFFFHAQNSIINTLINRQRNSFNIILTLSKKRNHAP